MPSMLSDSTLKKLAEYGLPLLILGVISRTFPILSPAYYIVPLLLFLFLSAAVYYFIKHNLFKLNAKLILILFLFPLYCLSTALWSEYPLITLERSLYLILLLAGILSAVFIHSQFSKRSVLSALIPANIFIVIISFFSLITGIPSDSWTGGHGLGFMGFAGHQNLLASAILFTLPGIVELILKQNTDSRQNLKKYYGLKIFILLLLASDLLLLLLSYSRAALLSLGLGILLLLILLKYKKLVITITAIFLLFVLSAFFIPGIQNILLKDSNDILDRRTILWEPSLTAAQLGGLTGLGYGVSAPSIITPSGTGSYYKNEIYIREKGNSTLALIEETGVIGLILFFLPIFYILIKTLRSVIPNEVRDLSQNDSNVIPNKVRDLSPGKAYSPDNNIISSLLITASLCALLLHSQFEAWMVGVGSVQLPLFFVFIGLIINQLCIRLSE